MFHEALIVICCAFKTFIICKIISLNNLNLWSAQAYLFAVRCRMNAIFNEILKTLIRPKQELRDSVNINNQMLDFVIS